MLIRDLLRSILVESFTDISVSKLGIDSLVKKADAAIDGTEAGEALDHFVGVPHDAMSKNIDAGIMQSNRLEDAYSSNPSPTGMEIKRQIAAAFGPVRNALMAKFGPTITLYRGQGEVDQGKSQRSTLSWTSDPRIAAWFASIDPRLMKIKPISDADIQKALKTYAETGKVKFLGKTYIRTDTPTDDPDLDEFYYEIYDKDGEMITDGDDLESQFRDDQRRYQELIDERNLKLKNVFKVEIPIDDIIWITDRAGQSEFILHNRPGARGYVDATGKLIR
jgi:hypothetical protein